MRSLIKPIVFARGAETRAGMGGYIPPNNLAVSPNRLRMVHICIPPNNLNRCAVERKFGEKSVLFLLKTFFWSSPEFGEKKCSIFL